VFSEARVSDVLQMDGYAPLVRGTRSRAVFGGARSALCEVSDVVGSFSGTVLILLDAVAILLLIACLSEPHPSTVVVPDIRQSKLCRFLNRPSTSNSNSGLCVPHA